MELRYLRSFASVAKHRSFTAAAQELFLTQSAVSQQIRSLELELGGPLFLRERHAVELTDAGHTLLPIARAMLDLATRAREALEQPRDVAGSLTIVAATVASSFLYVGLYERFARRYPDIAFSITTGVGRETALAAVREGRADAAFVQLPATDDLACEQLGLTTMVAVGRPPVEPSPAPLLVWDGSEELLRELGERRAAVRSNDISLLKRLADQRIGVAVVPLWAVKAELDDGALVAVDCGLPAVRQRFGVAYRAGEPSEPLAAFLATCAEFRGPIAAVTGGTNGRA